MNDTGYFRNQCENEDSIGYHVRNVSRALAKRLNRNFQDAGYDVTAEQWTMLCELWQREGYTQRELAELSGKDKTSVTRLIYGLDGPCQGAWNVFPVSGPTRRGRIPSAKDSPIARI